MKKNKYLFLIIPFLFTQLIMNAQLTGFIKIGVNIGTINKENWYYPFDSTIVIPYNKALIRPVFGMGIQYQPSNNWIFRQEIFFQYKGQGTIRPDVRTLFNTTNPDILRFMSFPFSIHRRIISKIYLGVAFEPSLYLTGTDNYYAKEIWHGWIYGASANIHGTFYKNFELGAEYDYDFTLYYCPGCDERFYTYRIYGMYHFLEKDQKKASQKALKKKK